MELKVAGKDRKLNFGVRFAALLDESDKYQADGIEFGLGLAMAEEKLEMGSLETLARVVKCALHRESVTLNDVYDALDEYANEEKLDEVFEKIEEELKNSNAVRTAKSRQEKMRTEANRKKGLQAVKHTKK